MARWLAWVSSVILLSGAIVFDLQCLQSGAFELHAAALRPIAFFLFGSVAFMMDYSWSAFSSAWPINKRHLAIFFLLALAASKDIFLFPLFGAPGPLVNSAMGMLGALFGLSLRCLPFIFGSRNPSFGWRQGSGARPDPSRPLVIIADPHWSVELTGLHEATRAIPDADWLFLGDVFEVWVGIKGFETDAQRNFLWWVAERRRTGHWVGLWLGNRDYFLDELADRFDFMGEGIGGRLHGEQFAFEHGDLVNTLDRKYRFWNLVSRSGAAWIIAKLLPSFIGNLLAPALERMLRTTNVGYKLLFPRYEFQTAAQECGAPLLIAGHFHALLAIENGLSLPWANEGRFYVWENGNIKAVDFGSAESGE
jgi:UDP-2,3-diacylglucosamine pyrophosphatase LpxH